MALQLEGNKFHKWPGGAYIRVAPKLQEVWYVGGCTNINTESDLSTKN